MAAISGKSLHTLREAYHKLLSDTLSDGTEAWVLLSHYGEFSQNKIDHLVGIVEQLVLEAGSARRVMKRVGSVMIEALQNSQIHGARDANGSSGSYFILKTSKENFHLHISNLILTEDANLIDYKIKELNKLDKSELRKLYIETLCNQNFSYKGGAGLGFLTIAKKASDKVIYEVEKASEEFSFFSVEIKVAR